MYSFLHDNFYELIELWRDDILLETPNKIRDKLVEVKSKGKKILLNLEKIFY